MERDGPFRKALQTVLLGSDLRDESPPAGPIESPHPGRLGVCCSGGGVRSAAYNLGVLQVLAEKEELRRCVYLSAVSGGAYIAGARSIVESQTTDKSLFNDLQPYAMGSPEEQWLRNHSNYIAPGISGKTRLLLRLLAGMTINIILIGLFLYLIARPLGWAYGEWLFPRMDWEGTNPFATVDPWAWLAAAIPGGLGIVLIFFDLLLRPPTALARFLVNWGAKLVFLGLWVSFLLVLLPYLVLIMRNELPHASGLIQDLATPSEGTQPRATPGIPRIALAAVVSLVVAALRALWAKRRAAVAMLVAAIAGPIAVISTFLAFANGGVFRFGMRQLLFWTVLAGFFLVLFVFSDLTNWSGHPFYKRRLGSAYAVRRLSNDQVEGVPYNTWLKLSQNEPPGRPELIVCAAANVSTAGATPPGRNAAAFTFTAKRVGGPLFGPPGGLGVSTPEFEGVLGRRGKDLTLLAAVAVSGAAASPSMGKLTRHPLTFLLALTGIRLGVWLPNPNWLSKWHETRPTGLKRRDRPRLHYLAKELFGINNIKDKFLYVTDGGHFENLGLVELLRRGCTLVYCFDASGEKDNTFFTLGQAIAIARTDLQVEIDIDPTSICPDQGKNRCDEAALAERDHVVGTIRFKDGTEGILVYAKTAVTKDSPYEVRAYRQRDKLFPHHPTFDQLFNDEKFEAYWSLGRHTAKAAIYSMKCEEERRKRLSDQAKENHECPDEVQASGSEPHAVAGTHVRPGAGRASPTGAHPQGRTDSTIAPDPTGRAGFLRRFRIWLFHRRKRLR